MFENFSDERREEYLESIIQILLPTLNDNDVRALLRKYPSYHEDENGVLFEEYVAAIHALPYLEKENVSLNTKCKLAKEIGNVFRKNGINTGSLDFFVKTFCKKKM